ncbi:MAG: hypothetical protein NPIRA04_21410 [Nitrospirales bacterium]|nr:MAG: hypothetical protein NPIRA04_21410 [Nitrospirales bacterium]
MKVILILMAVVVLGYGCSPSQRWAYEARPGLIFVGGFVLYYDSEAPLSYQALTSHERPDDAMIVGEVMGDSCQHGLSIPIIFSATDRTSVSGANGDGSYKKALLNIREKHPDLVGLYDVKVDVHKWSILTYSRECTVVVAQGFTRSGLEGPLQLSAKMKARAPHGFPR